MMRAGEHSETVLETVSNGIWQVPSGTKIEREQSFNEAAATLLISVFV